MSKEQEIRDRVKRRLEAILTYGEISTIEKVQSILSIPNLKVVDLEAELPDKVMIKFKCKPELTMAAQSELGDTALMAYGQAQQDMLKAGWGKGIKDE